MEENSFDALLAAAKITIIGYDPNFSEKLPKYVEDIESDDVQVKFHAIRQIRKALSCTRDPPIKRVVASGVLPSLIHCLATNQYSPLQFPPEKLGILTFLLIEAAWTLANVAGGDSASTQAVVDAGAIPVVTKLLKDCNNWELCFQLTWVTANLLGESAANRALFLECGLLKSLEVVQTELLSLPELNWRLLVNVAWVFVNLARCKDPMLDMESAAKVMTLLGRLSQVDLSRGPSEEFKKLRPNFTHSSVVADSIWGFYYICNAGEEFIDMFVKEGFLPRLFSFLESQEGRIVWPAMHTIGCICKGTDAHVQMCLDAGLLKRVPHALGLKHWKINKDVAWLLSNVSAGSQEHIDLLLVSGTLQLLIKLVEEGGHDIVQESIECFANLLLEPAPQEQVSRLTDMGIAGALAQCLEAEKTDQLKIVLKCILLVLENAGERLNVVCEQFRKAGGLEYVKKLKEHAEEEIYTMAYDIYDEYFLEEKKEEEAAPEKKPDRMTIAELFKTKLFRVI